MISNKVMQPKTIKSKIGGNLKMFQPDHESCSDALLSIFIFFRFLSPKLGSYIYNVAELFRSDNFELWRRELPSIYHGSAIDCVSATLHFIPMSSRKPPSALAR
jgi:hypothetical protein